MGDGEPSAPEVRAPRWLLPTTMIVALWAMLPPWVGPGPTTRLSTEIIDHPVPALVVLAVVAYFAWRRTAPEERWFVAGLVVTLAGIWTFATHAPLVAQAIDDEVGWAAAINHTAPTALLLAVGITWTWQFR